MYFIGYTTDYRKGSDEFARAALTLREGLRLLHPEEAVALEPLERKRDLVSAMRRLELAGVRLDELHWIGHSGMYGPMFGSTRWPEQLSPHEWLLACTHYPAIAGPIAARVPQALLFDPAEAVIERLLLSPCLPAKRAPDLLLTTGSADGTRRSAVRAWGIDPGPYQSVVVES